MMGVMLTVMAQPDPPCEEFNCHNYVRCGVNKLACDAFYLYYTTGDVLPPEMQKGKKSRDRTTYYHGVCIPTRKIFDKMHKDEDF